MGKHQGMTLIGMLLTMAVVIIGGILLMRVVPVYLQHYTITQSLHSLNTIAITELSADPITTANIFKKRLVKQLYVNSVELPPEQIKVAPNARGNYDVSVKYQVIKPLIYNANLLFIFDDSYEVKPSAG